MVHHLTITLGATATAASPSRVPAREVWLESETGNADVKIGDSTVTSTNYGKILTAGPTNAIVFRPPDGNLAINIETIYLLGTQNQKVHVLYFN